jgi:hypothetical protein
MPLGNSSPEWVALCEALTELAHRTGAANAVVMDAFNALWSRAFPLTPESQQHAFDLLARALSTSERPLQSGGHVKMNTGRYLAESFATVYVLILWFDSPYDESWVRAAVRHALPIIEQLTVSLPPPDEPGPLAGASSA